MLQVGHEVAFDDQVERADASILLRAGRVDPSAENPLACRRQALGVVGDPLHERFRQPALSKEGHEVAPMARKRQDPLRGDGEPACHEVVDEAARMGGHRGRRLRPRVIRLVGLPRRGIRELGEPT